ncbi:MAG: hypothetical protein OXG82_08540 [Gammaproteobacteria bacterium]|nr:hypothetical protein [Gammaproteobacteria bacterium]
MLGRRVEIVQRLKIAQERTREAYERTFKGHDLHPGTDIAGAWPFITAAYSGIEQTFKFLIAEAEGKTVEELVATPRPKGAKGEARFPYRHHNLATLFRFLGDSLREALAEEYRRFRTLHQYIEPATLAAFLDSVSAEDGRGYERWRYSLTAPEAKIPTNSADALLSIWDVAVQLCDTDREGWRLRGVYEQLSEGFGWSLEEIMGKLNEERMNSADSADAYHDFRGEARDWMRAHGGLLNAYAKLVHRAHRRRMPGADEDGVSAPLAECLRRWLAAGERRAVQARADVDVFVDRAAGYRGPAQGVRWNRDTAGFEDVPWGLCETLADEPPPGAYRFEDDRRGTERVYQQRLVYRRGFRVVENHPAREAMPAGKWLCTLCGQKADVPNGELTVRFWENPDDEDGFYVEVDGCEDTKEGRFVREVLRVESENTRGEGAYIVESDLEPGG